MLQTRLLTVSDSKVCAINSTLDHSLHHFPRHETYMFACQNVDFTEKADISLSAMEQIITNLVLNVCNRVCKLVKNHHLIRSHDSLIEK